MSVRGGNGSGLAGQVAERWRLIDPLLPAAAAAPPAGAGHQIAVTLAGRQVAGGWCEHWAGAPDSLDLTWGAARRFELTPQIPGPDIGGPLDLLLERWRDHLAGEAGTADGDSAAVVTWPSRDIGGVMALVGRGFAPLAVIAARQTRRDSDAGSPPAATAPGISIRRAGDADADEIVRLGLDVIRFDAQVCGVTERPETAAALRREIGGLLADPEPWIWLAERSGSAIGMLAAEKPATAQWIAPLTRVAPVAYLLLMGVSAGRRGSGVGAAMAAQLHREVESAGVAVTLLHYAQVNPLSAPFWSQQGYRPLWTVWEAMPALAVR